MNLIIQFTLYRHEAGTRYLRVHYDVLDETDGAWIDEDEKFYEGLS